VKIGARVFIKRETLGQRPNVSPIPFAYEPVTSKVVRGNRFDSNLHNPGDYIFVGVRTSAHNKPRNARFQAGRAAMKSLKTCCPIGSRGGDLRDGQHGPSGIAKSHQIASGRLAFGRQSTRQGRNRIGISSCRPASDKFLCTHVHGDQGCH